MPTSLQWFPMTYRIKVQILNMALKISHNVTSSYIFNFSLIWHHLTPSTGQLLFVSWKNQLYSQTVKHFSSSLSILTNFPRLPLMLLLAWPLHIFFIYTAPQYFVYTFIKFLLYSVLYLYIYLPLCKFLCYLSFYYLKVLVYVNQDVWIEWTTFRIWSVSETSRTLIEVSKSDPTFSKQLSVPAIFKGRHYYRQILWTWDLN